MSITYNIKKEGLVDSIDIPGVEISAFLLQKLLADKLNTKQSDLTLYNHYTSLRLMPMEILKDKSIVHVDRIIKQQPKVNLTSSIGIVSNEQLAEMGQKGRFFMIKSSNEENIQKARQFSVWATTFSNQDKLRSAFLYTQNVFLFFATNRSYQLKGLARMEKQPSKTPQKTFWAGVTNIRLGGNFQIRWIRKEPLTPLKIQKVCGSQIRDRVMRLSDGQEIDGQLAQQIITLFDVPTQPYYQIKQVQNNVKNVQRTKRIPGLGQILSYQNQFFSTSFPFLPPPQRQGLLSQVSTSIAVPPSGLKTEDSSKNKKQETNKIVFKDRQSSSLSSSSSSSRNSSPSRSRSKRRKQSKQKNKNSKSKDKNKKMKKQDDKKHKKSRKTAKRDKKDKKDKKSKKKSKKNRR